MDEHGQDKSRSQWTEYARLFGVIVLLTFFICAAFTAVASWTLWAAFLATGTGESAAFMAKLLLKALLFSGATAGCAWGLWRMSPGIVTPTLEKPTPAAWTSLSKMSFFFVLACVSCIVLPRLSAFPWTAPDETYHLSVARNLARYGLYASGNPEQGFTRFDPYDSVGAPVIVPVAAALCVAGTTPVTEDGIAAGRLVIAVYYLLFCVAAYLLACPIVGRGEAAAGILVLTASFGSTYLARTLYGEAPAMAWFVLGLLAWRRSLRRNGPSGSAVLAGIAFGLAILCKSIMVLSAFAVLGAIVYDRLTFRRIRWPHVFLPAFGAMAVVAAWWVIQSFARHDLGAAAAGTLGLYKHNLMFGYRSAAHALKWMLDEPLALVGIACGMAIAAPTVFRRRYDPAMIALFLLALFFAYWWMFFTPGQIPRYVWFSYAVGGLFAGAMAWNVLKAAWSERRLSRRTLAALLVLVVAIPAGTRASKETKEVFASDEMRDEYEVAFFVRDLPRSTTVSTTYWPLARTLNLLADRTAQVIQSVPDVAPPNAVVLVDAQTQERLLRGHTPTRRLGRYAIFGGSGEAKSDG